MTASTTSAPRTGDVRFGFLGAGWIASRALAPAVHAAQGAVLQAAAARDGDRARALEPAGRVHVGEDAYAALLEDPDVDAVYISLTNEVHLRWTLAALEAGKHVLCEKPLGLDVAEVRRMHDAADAAGLVLLEGFFYRWHPRMRRLGELVSSGLLGPVRAVRSQFCFTGDERLEGNYRLDPGRGGGALYDVGVYPLSAAHALLPGPLSVTTAQAASGPTGVDLDCTARLVAEAGAVVDLRCSIAGPTAQSLEVDCGTTRLSTGEGETFTNWHEPSSLRLTSRSGVGHGLTSDAVRTERFAPVDPYRLMVEAFAAAVRGTADLIVDREHSLAVAGSLAAVRQATT